MSTPKSERLHIAIVGKTNVGKSSFINLIAGQDVSITSDIAGTTTDVVEKTMELLPIGPVVLMDTAGLDDVSELGSARIAKTRKILRRTDVLVIVTTPNSWEEYENSMTEEAIAKNIPVMVVVNKADTEDIDTNFLALLDLKKLHWISGNSTGNISEKSAYKTEFKNALRSLLPLYSSVSAPPLAGDLLPSGGLAVLVVPIDLGAPKGRLIVPQVQCIRDLLDNDCMVMTVKDKELYASLKKLNYPPDIVICDSQVVARTVADIPDSVPMTTFSILFARYKGNLEILAKGAAQINRLKSGDKILIAEGCSHHPLQDDIGRIKIPRWLRQFTGAELEVDICAGHDFPDNLDDYSLVIHCGGCVMTGTEVMSRIDESEEKSVPITNYGLAISVLQGVIHRALSPFPSALDAYDNVIPISII